MSTVIQISDCVEYFRAVKTEVEELKRVESWLRGLLGECGQRHPQSDWHQLTVALCDGRRTTNHSAIYAELGVPQSVIERHTRVGESYFSVGHLKAISASKQPGLRRLIREAKAAYRNR